MEKTSFIDLKLKSPQCHTSPLTQKEMAYEYRENSLCAVDGFYPHVRVPQMCRALPGKLQDQKLFMPGSIPLDGLCSTHIPGEPSGYRGMSQGSATQALPSWDTREGLRKYPGKRQSGSGLAHLCRLRTGSHRKSTETVHPRFFWSRAESYRIRPGLHHHRSLSLPFSLGRVQETKKSHKNSYASGSPGQYSQCSRYYSWKGSRRKYHRSDRYRTRCTLYLRPRISRFCPSSQDTPIRSLFRHPCKKEFSIQTPLFSGSRQINRSAMRSDCNTGNLLYKERLSFKTPENPLLRCREQQTPGVSHQQFYLARTDYCQFIHAVAGRSNFFSNGSGNIFG